LVLFALNEIEMPWKYFLQSVGLQEEGQGTDQQQEEQEVDQQSEEKRDEGNQEIRVSPEPGCSSKVTQQTRNKKLHLKRGEPDLKGPNQLLQQKRKSLEGS
jgi:hypothetical protein